MATCAANCEMEGGRLFPICPNQHYLHPECLKGVLAANRNATCPLCRDDTIEQMRAVICQQPEPRPPTQEEEDEELATAVDLDTESEYEGEDDEADSSMDEFVVPDDQAAEEASDYEGEEEDAEFIPVFEESAEPPPQAPSVYNNCTFYMCGHWPNNGG